MQNGEPMNMLVVASYFKGERFMRQAAARGVRVHLLTVERHLHDAWPRDILTELYAQSNDNPLQNTINTVSYLARTLRIDRIVPLDDFDVETAATLREHLRIPGMGDTTARHFRDKLAMRVKSREEGIPVPDFVHILNYDAIREFIQRVPAPWMFKPRWEAGATGIVKVENEAQLWDTIHSKGDKQSYFLLEKYLPGDVFHVDSIITERKVVFQAVHRYMKPPFNVAHGGGIFSTMTVERGSQDDLALRELNTQVLTRLNLLRGVSHVEFIKSHADGKFYMLESAARVGGAHIAEVIEASSGVNLWAEWANIEVDGNTRPYVLPPTHEEYAGIALTLARQEQPDLSAYNDPEVVYRAPEKNHAGLIVRAKTYGRVKELLESYQERFSRDFFASMPAKEKTER